MTFIVRWDVSGALRSPKNILTNRYNSSCKARALLYLSFSSISSYQYPILATNVETTVALSSESTRSFIRGMGYEPCFVTTLSLQLSTQIRKVPSFLGNEYCGGCPLGLYRIVDVSSKNLLYLDYLKLSNFWADAARCGIYWRRDWV